MRQKHNHLQVFAHLNNGRASASPITKGQSELAREEPKTDAGVSH
jgi:hypothetical protein